VSDITRTHHSNTVSSCYVSILLPLDTVFPKMFEFTTLPLLSPTDHTAQEQQQQQQASNHSADTLYSLLDISSNANTNDIRQAYKKALVTAHPDKGGSPDTFFLIQNAYTVLSDPASRAAYDDQLRIHTKKHNINIPSSSVSSYYQGGQQGARIVRHTAAGVTVIEHGQTNNGVPSQPGFGPGGRRVFQNIYKEDDNNGGNGNNSNAMLLATDRIRDLISKLSNSINKSNDASSSSNSQLAGAYIERAMLCIKVHRYHHALFDVQEALRLDCSNTSAQMLVIELQNLMARGGKKRERGTITTTTANGEVTVHGFDNHTTDDDDDIHLDF
jgi:curved DNA-binding protein CbpA